MKQLIAKNPIYSFIILTLLWSWGWWSLLFTQIRPGGILNNPLPLSYLLVVLGGLGPSLIGMVLTKIIYGKRGMEGIKNKLKYQNVGKWWLALLLIPTITAVTPMIRNLFTGYPILTSLEINLFPGIMIGIMAGLMEEFGWRGFLLPQLLRRYPPIISSLIIGLVWGGLWHGYADYFGLGDRGAYFIPLMLLVGPALLTAWSIVLTWVYQNTNGNLLVSILMHTSISTSAFIFGQRYSSYSEELGWTFISVLMAWVTAGLLIYSKSLDKALETV